MGLSHLSHLTYDVVILGGGGITGLAAATELTKLGAKVCLLEARTRLGGQISTHLATPHIPVIISNKKTKPNPTHFPVELGAMIVQGPGTKDNPNPLLHKLKHYNIAAATIDNYHSDLRDTEGSPLSLAELQANLMPELNAAVATLQKTKHEYHDDYETTSEQRLPTVAEVLHYKNDNIPKRDSPAYWTRKFMTAIISHHTGADIQDLSLLDLMYDKSFAGKPHLVVGGYQQFAERLAEDAKSTKNFELHLNTIVKKIKNHPKEKHIEIMVEDGRTFISEAALCTLPLEVLKRSKIIFEPELSKEKKLAFQAFNMGNQNKVLLEFEKPFWPKDAHFLYPNHSSINYWPEYLNLFHFSHHTVPALLACFYGDNANFGKKSNREIVDIAMEPLKRAYPEAVAHTKPVGFKISHWDTYTYSLGSGLYCGPNATLALADALNAAEPGGLFFANGLRRIRQGLQATVEGAYEAGVEVALFEIVPYLKHKLQIEARTSTTKKKK